MLRRLRIRRRTALHLAAMAAVLGAATAALGHGAAPAHAELTPDNGLLVSTREDFRMCVHTADGVADPARARADLAAGLAHAQQHPDWRAAFGAAPSSARAATAADCPDVTLPARVDRTTLVGPGVTEEPSPYRTWVHVLDDRTADRLLGEGVPALSVTAEALPDGERHAATVSTAVLVRRDHLDDKRFQLGTLTRAVGLQPQQAPPAGVHGPATVKEHTAAGRAAE